jgi:hypothetical protein
MRTCENCHFNYRFIKEPDGSILETEKGDRCQNRKSAFYNQDCKAVKICGKWIGNEQTR